MGNNDAAEQLEAAKEEIVRLEHQLAEARGLQVHERPTMADLPGGTTLVTDYVVHAAFVQPVDDRLPAVPAVQLQLSTMQPNDSTQKRTISTLIIEQAGARGIRDGLTNCLTMLDNFATNQETPNHG